MKSSNKNQRRPARKQNRQMRPPRFVPEIKGEWLVEKRPAKPNKS